MPIIKPAPGRSSPPPGVSFDGRSAGSQFWGKATALVKMCPHVKPGGGVCGLEPKHCFCTCLLCGSLMHGSKVCNARMSDGTRCPWGADRSPDVSSPEQDPAPPPRKRRAVQFIPSAAPQPSPLFFDQRIGGGLCLPNLEPGGKDGLPPQTPRKRTPPKTPPPANFDLTPPASPVRTITAMAAAPLPRPPTKWNRTLFAQTPPSVSFPSPAAGN